MTTQFIDSYLHCPRDGKRLVIDAGQDADEGHLTAGHDCLHCGYHEESPRTVAQARTGETYRGLTSLADLLAAQRLDGWVVPLKAPEADA